MKNPLEKDRNGHPKYPKIALFSSPWPLYNRPSIQLGALKSFIRKENAAIHVDCFHPYLMIAEKIGYKRYQALSEKSWLSECIYAWLLFPGQRDKIGPFFNRLQKKIPELSHTGIGALASQVKELSDVYMAGIPLQDYGLIGFSVSICQLTSARYFAGLVRKGAPALKIVMGGSLISGMDRRDLKILYPETDCFIQGEGEWPLMNLLTQGLESDPCARTQIPGSSERAPLQMDDLETLPVPDFSDYFKTLETLPVDKKFFPVLPVEFSRGCWWHTRKTPSTRGCAFCNLNCQWDGYRAKPPAQVVREIDLLTRSHRSLGVAVMDNVLPHRGTAEYFSGIQALDKDLSIFCELRAGAPFSLLSQMRSAGVDHVQVGIEALSSRLLKKLNKGTTAIQNIQIMRDLEELNMVNGSNLMIHFPGSDEEDVRETLFFLEFVMPFKPLKIVSFQLAQGSGVFLAPQAFGVKGVRNHPNYGVLFPKSVCSSVQFMQKSYAGNLQWQKRAWKPVREKILAWEKAYTSEKKRSALPLLSYRDGNGFLLIRQVGPAGSISNHRLEGKSAEIYLFCTKNRSFTRIAHQFQDIPHAKLHAFLTLMVEKKLMVEERGRYLSLAVRNTPGFLPGT